MKQQWMKLAIELAHLSAQEDEVPVGCVIIHNDEVIATGRNQRQQKQETLNHAELIAISEANEKLGSWRLEDCTLVVTLEPCPMCAGAIMQARIPRVIFGAYDPKAGAYGSVFDLNKQKGLNHYPEVTGGVLEEACASLLTNFFRNKRENRRP